jgi:hypothetical protein
MNTKLPPPHPNRVYCAWSPWWPSYGAYAHTSVHPQPFRLPTIAHPSNITATIFRPHPNTSIQPRFQPVARAFSGWHFAPFRKASCRSGPSTQGARSLRASSASKSLAASLAGWRGLSRRGTRFLASDQRRHARSGAVPALIACSAMEAQGVAPTVVVTNLAVRFYPALLKPEPLPGLGRHQHSRSSPFSESPLVPPGMGSNKQKRRFCSAVFSVTAPCAVHAQDRPRTARS